MGGADALIATLGLLPHPEGGWYAETWRAEAPAGTRPAGSAIYFLLRAGESSRWHRIDAAEAWHHYAGAALELRIATSTDDAVPSTLRATHRLGSATWRRRAPRIVVPRRRGRRPGAVPGPWSVAPCRRRSSSPGSSWRPRAGRLETMPRSMRPDATSSIRTADVAGLREGSAQPYRQRMEPV
jgi:predicted cupin superfamily sugar epimerase